jgi:hypothetical protein
MSNVRFTGLLALCAALAACSESAPNPAVTAPHVGSALQARAEQAATGPRASGHADITVTTAGATEQHKYSFIALSTGPSSPDAKGQAEGHITDAMGSTRDVHADVDCLRFIGPTATEGPQAVVSGPITKLRVNNEERDPQGQNLLFRVVDNGEGGTAVDEASRLLIISDFDCRSTGGDVFDSENGNIQVRP